jgi:CubicO group peptidase (beta-lactamase class C family)
LNKTEEIINQFHEEKRLSGTILISKNNNIIFEQAYGDASIQLGVPNKLDTKFHIASVTKMFIAAAALKLYSEGKLNLDHHPSTYLSELNNLHPNITIHHLLSHTSGLFDIYAVPDLRHEVSKLVHENGDFLKYLGKQEQLFNPGEQWKYSSTGFLLVAYIVEKVMGTAFEMVLQEMFFEPLGMNDTGQDNPRLININRAYGHTIVDGEYRNAKNDKLADLVHAPGELYSTVGDLNIWCNSIIKGEILSEELSNKMFTPHASVDFDPGLKYGYGWFLSGERRLIGGGTPGFRSEVFQYPEHKINVIMLWNNEKINSHELFWRINDSLFN